MSLYRKHRPKTFDEVVGQEHVVRTLRNAVAGDRVAHAYLFAGPRGTGKTSMAKILAKALNCEHGPTPTPCTVCEACRAIHDATSIDVIELDAASHRGIDDIREIRDKVALRPALGRRKVYIVDEAHMLTKEASNAVLKTLEEPPDHVVFVLCTTELQAMLPTIRSRCQRFAFFRPGVPELVEVLTRIAREERIEADEPVLALVARSAAGSFRDAVSMLDQLATATDGRIAAEDVRALLGTTDEEALFRALDAVAAGDAAGALRLVDELVEGGTDLSSLVVDLLGHLRRLFLVHELGELPPDLPATEEERERLVEQARRVPPAAVHRFVDELRGVLDEVREGGDPRLPLELAFVRVCRPAVELSLDALQQRLERLEGLLDGVAGAPSAAPAHVVPPRNGAEQTPVAPAEESADVARAWEDAILPEVERRSAPLHALLRNAAPTSYENGELVLAFGRSKAFFKTAADTPQNMELLRAVVRQALAGETSVRLAVVEDEPDSDEEPEQPTLSEEEIVSRFKSEFDAREIEEAR